MPVCDYFYFSLTLSKYPDNFSISCPSTLVLGIFQKCRESTHRLILVSLKVIAANVSFANSATTLAKKLLFSRNTCGLIQGKNLIVAQYATFLALMLAL